MHGFCFLYEYIDDLFPKFPGFQKFLTIFFPTPLPTSEEFGLVKFYIILHTSLMFYVCAVHVIMDR